MLELFLVWTLVGILAQLIDGALGMAYGVTSTTALISTEVYPALASVHTAEIFTTLVSGGAHLKFGNVERNMALHLAIPGIIGGITGAYVLTNVSGKPLSVIVGIILLAMGLMILYRFTFKRVLHFRTEKLPSKNLCHWGTQPLSRTHSAEEDGARSVLSRHRILVSTVSPFHRSKRSKRFLFSVSFP